MVIRVLAVIMIPACNIVLMKLNATSFSILIRRLVFRRMDAFFTGLVTKQGMLRILELL